MMNPRQLSIHLAAMLSAWLVTVSSVCAEATSRISSRFLARGEQALLEVAVVGHKPTKFPQIDAVRGLQIKPSGRGPQTQLLPGRRIEHVFEYTLSSYEVGNHTIPPITVEAGGTRFTTEPLEITVFNPDELRWSKNKVGNTEFRYASTFRVMDSTPYEGESIPVEIKVFVPRDLFVVDWGIPDFDRDGVTAWRFQPSKMRSQINLLGMPYVSVAYPSLLTPTRTGTVGIGPASIRLVTTQVVMDGILRRVSMTTQLQVPELRLNALPLPGNAPTGFENAVGNFKIDVRTPTTEVPEGDPIPLEITVRGSGNLDSLQPPKPVNSLGWKVYEASREPRGAERRELAGTTVFQQFMRPLELKGEIPPFRLVFFNPQTESYESVVTDAIPLQMTPAAATNTPVGPPPAAGTPIEEMADILGLIPGPHTRHQPAAGIRGGWIHAVGATLALLLILKALWRRFGSKLSRSPHDKQRAAALEALTHHPGPDREFLMEAGRFIERWLGDQPSEELTKILEERDLMCFRKEQTPAPTVPPERRKSILDTLRRAAPMWLILAAALATTGKVHAQDTTDPGVQAYQEARYDEAIRSWLGSAKYDDLSPDTLYHIGNACYRAGSPGHAALYYRRAIGRDPNHQEARQNLRFIERKYGALTVQRPDYQYTLAKLPLEAWRLMTWCGLWLCLLAALVFPATGRQSRLRITAIITLVIAPMIATCGVLGWRHFPDDAVFAELTEQAVIVDQQVTVHTDASRTSAEVIQAPPGSLCQILHDTGRWSYVSFATRTRGWVLSSSVRRIIPHSPPTAPEIRKPKAGDHNA